MTHDAPDPPEKPLTPEPMASDAAVGDLMRQRFAASVPDFDNGERIRHPFATHRLVVVFRRGNGVASIRRIFAGLGITEFNQEKNPLTYVFFLPVGENRFHLLKKISRSRQVRYVGPYRERGP